MITSAIYMIERPLSKEKINVEIFNKKNISIELNGEERYIQVFAYVEILLIEIKDSDKIIKDINFLECDAIYFSGNEQYKDADRDIFTLQYFNNNYEIKKGKIGDYYKYYFEHNMDVNPDLLGSPIFSTNTLKVIGIQKMIDKDFDDENKVTKYGAFIGEIFKRSLYNKCINNYIIGVIDVTEEFSEYNNSLYIMNYYGNLAGDVKEYLNGNEIVQCIIEIDNIKYPFSDRRFFKGVGKYKVEISNLDEIGNIYKIENMLKSFENKINTVKEQIAYNEKQLIDIKDELDKPFTQQDRIRELQKEKARIDSELDLDKQENARSVEQENEEELER